MLTFKFFNTPFRNGCLAKSVGGKPACGPVATRPKFDVVIML